MAYTGPLTPPDPNAAKGYRPRGNGSGQPLTPEEEDAINKASAGAMQSQRESNGAVPGGAPTTNFELSKEASAGVTAAQAREAENMDGDVYSNLQAARAREDAAKIVSQEQAKRGGVETADATMGAGGISGFFGGKEQTTHFTAGKLNDTTTVNNRAGIAGDLAAAQSRDNQTMQAAQIGPGGQVQGAQAQAAQLGTAAQTQAAQVGNAAQAQAARAQAANIATDPQAQFRSQQMGLAGLLGQSAAGLGPSAAQTQLKLATDRNMSQALALALGARGGNQAAAMRQAQMQRALISQEAAAQSSALRAQEQQQAQSALGGLLAQGRGADIGLATDQAGLQQQVGLANQSSQNQMALANQGATNQFSLANQSAQQQANLANQDAANQFSMANQSAQQQTNLANQSSSNAASMANQNAAIQQAQLNQQANAANLDAGLKQQQMKDEIVAKYRAMGIALDDATLARELQQAQFNAGLLAQQSAADKGVAMQGAAAGAQQLGAIAATTGAAISGLATIASDKRAKFDIKPAESKLEEFFSKAGAHDYRYREPQKPLRGEGRFVSPMAQELEQSEIGKALVRTGADGVKVVDYGRAIAPMLSGLAMVFQKVKKLEIKQERGQGIGHALARRSR